MVILLTTVVTMFKDSKSDNPWEHLDTRPAEMFRHPKAPDKGSIVAYVVTFIVVISAVAYYMVKS
ncbi:MAG: hypothetical protein KAY82_03090 [Hylemonella sp.]|nr:hypothetical protein [Hylemonella sp.]